MHRILMLTAVALVAASCGAGGETASTLESLNAGSTVTMPPTTTEISPPPTAYPSPDSTPPESAARAGPPELPDSDYPDVVVADLAGGDINLKELVLETEPVLLWFWAPH